QAARTFDVETIRLFILRCECNGRSTRETRAPYRLVSIGGAVVGARCAGNVAGGGAGAVGGAVDRSADDGGAHGAAGAGLDRAPAVSRALRLRAAAADLAELAARGDCRGGRALLSAPRLRLAADPDCGKTGYGRRAHARRFDDHAAAGEESVLRNGAVGAAQGRRGVAGAGGGSSAEQAEDSGAVSECGGVGAG